MTDREKLAKMIGDAPVWKSATQGEACTQIADHLLANGVTVQGWIPVTERPPDKEYWEHQKKYGQDQMEVLVMIKGARTATTLYYDDDGDFIDDTGDAWLVTHWMPLPQPPKGE